MAWEDKIKPHLSINYGKELSAEEFQNSLYAYFEDKGIISTMRAHLRAQMVNALMETSFGRVMVKKSEISPKIQAQNLLVAEYLLHRNYHYTLSVLSSEVPLNNTFPPITIDDCKGKNDAFHFADNDVCDILEAVGLNRQPLLTSKLVSKYTSDGKESLLACILHNIPGFIEETNAVKQDSIKMWLSKNDMQTLDLESMINLLKTTGVNIDIILQICEIIKDSVVNEVQNLKQVKDEQLYKLKKRMTHDTACKTKKYKERLAKIELCYKEEKCRLECELQQAKEELRKAASRVQSKYAVINQLNDHIKSLQSRLKQQEQALLAKECKLKQRQEFLENKQKLIDEQFQELLVISRSQQVIAANNAEKETEMKQPKTICQETETKFVPQVSASIEVNAVEAVELREGELQKENSRLKRCSAHMREEITKLKDQNFSYQNKIQELLVRTNGLLAQLETRRRDVHRSHSALPTVPAFMVRACDSRVPSYHGGGEEGGALRSSSPREMTPRTTVRDPRRRKALCTLIQTSSSEDISPTDGVLQEAKLRLLELEEESAAIDKHFDGVTKSTLRTADSNAACIIQSFQTNVSMIRNSLSKMFGKQEKFPTAKSLDHTEYIATDERENAIQDNPNSTEQTGKTYPTESRVPPLEEPQNSTTSSAMVINTSLSTIDVSAGDHSSSMGEWQDIDD